MGDIDKENMLKALECPFTWNITTKNKHVQQDDYKIDDEIFPLPKLLLNVVSVYTSSINEEDLESVKANLQKCKDDLAFVKRKEHPHISSSVLQHIVLATEIHVLSSYGIIEELESQLRNVILLDGKYMTYIETATLEACKSIVWSHYDLTKSIDFMRKATRQDPNCDMWHYTLGKELRRLRRDKSIHSKPAEDEFNCFKMASDLADNPLCGVMYAQTLRESRKFAEAKNKYYKIYSKTRPDEFYVLLKLALGFMQCRVFSKAEKCLNNAALIHPDFPLYLHYRGMYHMKKKQFKEAVEFLERAITEKHFGVEKQWLYCKVQADESFDPTNDVLKMIEKYKDFSSDVRLHLQLELAMCYEKKNEDIDAVKSFIKAIEIDPQSITLKRFNCSVNRTESRRDIYTFLKKDFLPRVHNQNIPAADTLRTLVYRD